jgi:hypothetical protein
VCCLAGCLLANVAARGETITSEGPQPSDPVLQWADQMEPANQFSLYSQQDVDLVRFRQPQMISLCVPRVNKDSVEAASHAVGVVVKWDGDTQTVTPGNCFSMDAQKVSVRPAGPVGANTVLNGTIKVMR